MGKSNSKHKKKNSDDTLSDRTSSCNNSDNYNKDTIVNKNAFEDAQKEIKIDVPINVSKKISISNLNIIGGSLQADIRKFYKFKGVLGGGSFGSVRKGYQKNDKSKAFAIKSIEKSKITKEYFESLVKEVEILSSLDHPNIIKFYETYNDEYYFHIVMELCTGKEVIERLLEDGHISEYIVSQIIFKLTQAIKYCHSLGITHRDIKPENILFETNEANSQIKLIDFGLSAKKDNSSDKMHSILGTPYFMAPEVLKANYDQKCDIWSIGAITYFMICGDHPFSGKNNLQIFQKIVKEELTFDKNKWNNISDNCKDFIQKCLIKDPQHRLSAEKALEHSWFKRVDKELHNTKFVDSEILLKLKNFSHPKAFKKIVLKYLVNTISPNELNKLRTSFVAIDTHNTGTIEIEEFEAAFKIAGIKISNEEIQKAFINIDLAKNGKINYTEFLAASIDQKSFLVKEDLTSAFNFFDVDNDGVIDSKDLKKAFLKSGKDTRNAEEFQKMIQEVNHDKDKISLNEFLKIFGF